MFAQQKCGVLRQILGSLAFAAIILGTPITIAAQKKVLFYGPTFDTNGYAAQFVATNSAQFLPIGTNGSAVWTPGHSDPSLDWSLKAKADFEAFHAIIIGAPSTLTTNPAVWAGALSNVTTWSAAISGNVIIFGGDPETHAGPDGGGGMADQEGAQDFIRQAIRFAADDSQSRPGLYLALAAVDPVETSPADSGRKAVEHLLSGLGDFTPVHGHFQEVRRIFRHPLFADITDDALSYWYYSVHTGFLS